jgi:DUF1707 SHOCT-like domain
VEPRLRASDAERLRVVAVLEQHTAAGRLTLDEFADRVDRVLIARTHAELADAVRDLPAEPAPDGDSRLTTGARHLTIALLLAALTLALLGVVLAVAR